MTCLSGDLSPRQSSRVAPGWNLSDALPTELQLGGSMLSLGQETQLNHFVKRFLVALESFSCSFFATFEAVFAKKDIFFFLLCFCFALFLHLFDIDSMKLSLGLFFIRIRVLMIFSFKCSGLVFAFLSFRSR